LIIAIGVAVRAYHLTLPIKYDEAGTFLQYAQHSLIAKYVITVEAGMIRSELFDHRFAAAVVV
jgi:hypothetical protein